jgi:hypothetical protein
VKIILDQYEIDLVGKMMDMTYRGTIRRTSWLHLAYNLQFRAHLQERFQHRSGERHIDQWGWPWNVFPFVYYTTFYLDRERVGKLP